MTTTIANVSPVNRPVVNPSTANHPVVSRQQWLAERKQLLEREKELTRLGDQIAAERRALPWVRMDKEYLFDTPAGRRPLADLFDGRHQLVMEHFMLAPAGSRAARAAPTWPTIPTPRSCTWPTATPPS